MYFYLLLLISLVFPANIFRGQIIDTSNKPIYGVNVQVLDTDFGSSTDQEGYFIIDNLESNHFTVKISHIAYQDIIIYMKPFLCRLQEI